MKKYIVYLVVAINIFSCTPEVNVNDQAPVKFIHASINAPILNFFSDGALLAKEIEYANASDYLFIPNGTATIRLESGLSVGQVYLYAAGAFNLAPNTNYTLIAADSANKMKVSLLNDTLDTPASGKAKIRFLQTVTDSIGTVDFFYNTTKLSGNRTFNDYSINNVFHRFHTVDTGKITLSARSVTGSAITSLQNVSLKSGKIYTFILRGSTSGTPNTIRAIGFTEIGYN